jgi:broad specificity phosphatase PhoE
MNKKVNIELGLYEYLHNPYFFFTKWLNNIDDINDIDLKSIINFDYKSIVVEEELIIFENEINLYKRIKKFFDYLLENYKDKTILLVTHKGVINKIKDIYLEETDMESKFEMGEYLILQQKDYHLHNILKG